MERFFRRSWGIRVILILVSQVLSQNNLIVNGDFTAGDSAWYLGIYGGANGNGSVVNGIYMISISNPGAEPWNIQLTQNRLPLDSGSAYIFSFDIYSKARRTIETSIARDGGDYFPYSGRDTITVDTQVLHYERIFAMQKTTDNNARIEFNCGKFTGDIFIGNVRLVKYTEPVISIISPRADDLLIEGVPFTISWTSINIKGGIRIDLSIDNGESWKTIGTLEKDTGSFVWVPETPFSPWCRIRVSSLANDSVFSITEGPFEIAPVGEMVKNGNFLSSAEKWNFNVYGGEASGGVVSDGVYRINIERSADEYWQIKLAQNGIALEKGKAYSLSFVAYAENQTTIQINICMDREPYKTYFDTSQQIVSLSTTPKRYVFIFTMKEESDSNCRLEFNCGKSIGVIFIDQVSLAPQYTASANRYYLLSHHASQKERPLLIVNGLSTIPFGVDDRFSDYKPIRIVDLRGRTVAFVPGIEARKRKYIRVPGIYFIEKGLTIKPNERKP